MKNYTEENKVYYEKSYKEGFLGKIVIKHFFSYDQLSKTKRNMSMLKECLKYPKSLSVLDYGYGFGTFLLRVPREHDLFGCEISLGAKNNLLKLGKIFNRKIVLFDIEEFESDLQRKYDVIVCSHVLEHVTNDLDLIERFVAALTPDGYVLFNVPINEIWDDPKHVHDYSRAAFLSILRKNKLVIKDVVESDRMSSYILGCEIGAKKRKRFLIRICRLFLALLPLYILDKLDELLKGKHAPQQLLVLCQKEPEKE